MKKIISLFTVLFFGIVFVCAKKVVIYHTSDIHGYYNARPAKWNKKNPKRLIGGFAALANLIKQEKHPYLLIDSGDWYQGGMEGVVTKGEASVILMNELNYTASALGNHEYDFSEPHLKKLLKKAKFTPLAANIENKTKPYEIDYAKPYIIKEIDGIKIAIIGLASTDTPHSTFPPYVAHLNFTNPAKTTAKYVRLLKNKADAIIVTAHSGLCNGCKSGILTSKQIKLSPADYKYGNIKIARKSKGKIAVVLGGHYHMAFSKGFYDKKSRTLFVESGSELTDVSRIEMEFDDETNEFLYAKSKLIPLWIDETGRDEKISKTMQKIKARVDDKLNEVIGYTNSNLKRFDGEFDSSLGNWITDIIAKAAGTKIAFQNTYGIRDDIYKGKVTLGTIYQVLPFENNIVTIDITGSQMIELMRQNLEADKALMQVAGMEVLFTVAENKIDTVEVLLDGKPVNPEEIYKVATNNYLTAGGTGGRVFLQGKNLEDTNINLRHAVVEYLKQAEKIKKPAVGRIRKINGL